MPPVFLGRRALLAVAFAALGTLSETAADRPPFPGFSEIAARAGVKTTLVTGTPSKDYLPEFMPGGVAFIDYDNDGWQDLYFVNGSTADAELKGSNTAVDRLFRNQRDQTFKDVTREAGLGDRQWSMGVCVADVDNNGYDDLLVANYGTNALYLNRGNGTFRDASAESGLADRRRWHSGCAFGDYDRDGDLDVYVSTYVQFDLAAAVKQPKRDRYHMPGPANYRAERHRFYENRGGGRFVDATEASGIGAADPYYGLGVAWGDYDNDGDLDIFVANDVTPNYLFRNNGDRTFTEVAMISGAAVNMMGGAQACMGVDAADVDNDGDLDILVTNYSAEYNTLYLNDGRGRFEEASHEWGLLETTHPFMGWGTRFVDLDLDGRLDLVTVNGHLFPFIEENAEARKMKAGYRQRNLVFRNTGGGFEEIGEQVDGFAALRVGRGLAVGDLNNDGQQDLVITNIDESPSILINKGASANWLMVALRGTRSNRNAVGARITVKTSGGTTQLREVQAGGSYLGAHDFRQHFGLGPRTTVDQLQVRWPDGSIETHRNIKANQILSLAEPPAKTSPN